jgi:hypothetical protein
MMIMNNWHTENFHQIFNFRKLFMFDISLVVETYVWSLVSELKASKEKLSNMRMC